MSEIFGFDAFSSREIAERVQTIGVAKARLPLLSMAMLGVLGGVVLSLGLLLIVVAGAELFTGDNLLVMVVLAMMLKVQGAGLPPDGDAIDAWGLAANLVPVIAGNLVGESVLVALGYHVIYRRSGQPR